MPPRRVLEVSKSTGGLGTYMRWLAHGLDRVRFAPTFVCLSTGAADLANELGQLSGVTAVAWPMNRYAIDPLGDARVIVRLRGLIRREKFDLVHAHGSKAGFIARVAAMGTGVPVAYSPHSFAFHAGAARWKANLYAFVERLAARYLTAKIITVSDGEQAEARRFGVGTPDLFVTVHSGVDLTKFEGAVNKREQKTALGVPPEAPLVSTVGRMSEQKGPLDFVRVAARLHQVNPEAHLVWVGDGPLEESARKLSAELGVQDALHFVGQRNDVPAILAASNLYLMTSHWEAFALALLEAMAAGLPVVAPCLDGIAEAVEDGVSGMLIPPGDLNGMAEAVQSILRDPALSSRMGANARRRIEQDFTRAQMTDKLMKVYDALTDGRAEV